MDIQGLRCIHIRRRQRSLTDSRKARSDGYFNLTRNLDIRAPFEVLSSDISYIRTGEGFDYLCQIKDVMSGVILAESMSEHMKADLVVKTIKKAIRRYDIPKGCVFHSDRGSQYTSEEVMNLLTKKDSDKASRESGLREITVGVKASSQISRKKPYTGPISRHVPKLDRRFSPTSRASTTQEEYKNVSTT